MIKLAIIAANWGIPVTDLLAAGRKLINKNCLKCTQAGEVLKKIHELGPKRAEAQIRQILAQ